METADEAYVKHCHFCGKKVQKPVLYKGYVFCSEECKESHTSGGQKNQK